MTRLKRYLTAGLVMLMLTLKIAAPVANADEGMWLLMLLDKNYEEMKEKGLKLTPEDIYNVNQASLKDAIVMLNNGSCTAELVSSKGLMFSNHHCAYDMIQSFSTTENNYLDNGFWARSLKEELPVAGATASVLVRMEDVTDKIKSAIDSKKGADKAAALKLQTAALIAEAVKGTPYNASVKEMFDGNQYFLFVYKTFRDVRLVGAPPSSIGKFGGDADNWEWPRHTGDFAVLRVYASPDGSPAEYALENQPYKPAHHLPVSLKGYEEGDFAMVMGFPGTTKRFLTSYGIEMNKNVSNPIRIKLREKRLALMKEDMDKSEDIRIKYSSQYSQISNYYKYYIGMNEGLDKLSTINHKRTEEQAYQKWSGQYEDKRYGTVLKDLQKAYKEMEPYEQYYQYLVEGAFGVEAITASAALRELNTLLSETPDNAEGIAKAKENLKKRLDAFYKDYSPSTDRKVFAAMMQMFYEGVPAEQHPEELKKLYKKYKGNWNKIANKVYGKSLIPDKDKAYKFAEAPALKDLEEDPLFSLYSGFLNHYYENIQAPLRDAKNTVSDAMAIYVDGLMKMNPDKNFYPDANSTLRLTYGTVKGYWAADAVLYNYYTTMDGLMAKEDPNDPEFVVPAGLKDLYIKKDFGMYGEDGQLKVNFITNTDITGGNSGSPVINANGELIGIAFDGNWEAMTGDLDFDEKYKRTINVDIRYVLFVIDKYAGADHLIKELTLVK